MTDKEQIVREFIQNNPNLSGNEALDELKASGHGIRRSKFYEIFRNEKNLPEPTKVKREASIPIKFRKPTVRKPTVRKPTVIKPTVIKPTIQKKLPIPFEKTKFGKIVKRMEKSHNISERRAIERARALLKIPRKDFIKLNRKDVVIILSESP